MVVRRSVAGMPRIKGFVLELSREDGVGETRGRESWMKFEYRRYYRTRNVQRGEGAVIAVGLEDTLYLNRCINSH